MMPAFRARKWEEKEMDRDGGVVCGWQKEMSGREKKERIINLTVLRHLSSNFFFLSFLLAWVISRHNTIFSIFFSLSLYLSPLTRHPHSSDISNDFYLTIFRRHSNFFHGIPFNTDDDDDDDTIAFVDDGCCWEQRYIHICI